MLARTFTPVRRWTFVGAALVLVASTASIVVGSQPSGAYDATGAWTLSGQTATTATGSGSANIASTVSASGGVTLSGHTPFSATNSPASSQFSPSISMGTDALRLSVGASCFTAGTCVPTGTYPGLGQLVVTFSQPVRSPTLHFEGIGANASSGTGMTAFHSTFTLDQAGSDGASLGAISPGATDLRVSGDTVEAASDFAGTSCASATDGGVTSDATAGCGSVSVVGTVTQLTFDVGVASTVVSGDGSNGTSGDAVGLAITFEQNYSAAPASYDLDGGAANAPRHILGDLALGSGSVASSPDSLDPVDSPSAVSPGSTIGPTPSDAVPRWPALTTAMIGSTYAVTVPITGASRAGAVCGYIDFAHRGSFGTDSDEQACQTFGAGDRSVTLDWTVPATTTAGLTYTSTQADVDAGQITVTSVATGTAGSAAVTSASSLIKTTVAAPSALRVDLTGEVNGSATIGDLVTLNAVVTNTGLTTVKGVSLTGLGGATSCPSTPLPPAASVTCSVARQTVTEAETNTGQVTVSAIATGSSGSGTVRSKSAVFAVAVAAPIPFTGVSDLGPTLGAGAGAIIAGIGVLMAASPGRRRRRA